MTATLAYIVVANVLTTVVSISLAAWLSFRWLSSLVDQLVCVSAGLLLTVAFTHLLPDAFQAAPDPTLVGWLLLGGILGLFLLEKVALIHHTHHHEGDAHHHAHGHDAHEARRGGWPVLIGDTFHNFADGVLVAAAFVADTELGIAATVAVLAHEVPHEIGDFMILLNAGFSRRKAFLFNLAAGASAVVGGVIGYFVLASLQRLLPYALALAAASFIYISLSDLLPEMMRRSSLRHSLPQVGLVLVGVAIAALASALAHAH